MQSVQIANELARLQFMYREMQGTNEWPVNWFSPPHVMLLSIAMEWVEVTISIMHRHTYANYAQTYLCQLCTDILMPIMHRHTYANYAQAYLCQICKHILMPIMHRHTYYAIYVQANMSIIYSAHMLHWIQILWLTWQFFWLYSQQQNKWYPQRCLLVHNNITISYYVQMNSLRLK